MVIGLLGHGVVGSGVREIIDTHFTDIKIKKILVKNTSEFLDDRFTTDINDILNDSDIDIVVECMGGNEPAFSYVKNALDNNKYVVTSNKKMLASNYDVLSSYQKKISFEATCGGGIPWFINIERIKRIDKINSIHGIMNGTTNYILYHMYEDNLSFNDTLKKAQELGFAEQDPSDDIYAYDVKYKLFLSIIKAFDTIINLDEIPTYGIASIKKEDIDYARNNQYVVKLLAKAINTNQQISALVMPIMLKNSNSFATISENNNMLSCNSDSLGPISLIGQGAGKLPTAHAVVQDILDIRENRNKTSINLSYSHNNLDVYNSIYYIRTDYIENFSPIISTMITDNSFLTDKISLSLLQNYLNKIDLSNSFICEVEND